MKHSTTKKGNRHGPCVIIGVLFILSFFKTSAQDYVRSVPVDQPQMSSDKKFRLGVSIGPAIPMLDFGSTNVKGSFWDQTSIDSTHLQGFAQTGFHFDVYASYLITDNFGLMAMIAGNSNSFNQATFSSTIGYTSNVVNGEDFYTGEYLIGPYFYFPLGTQSKLSLSAFALVGFVSSNYPEVSLAINDTVNAAIQFLQGGNRFGFCFGGTLACSLSDNIDVTFNISYSQTKAVFPSWTETFTAPGYYPATLSHPTDQTSMPIGLLKPTIGIAFKF